MKRIENERGALELFSLFFFYLLLMFFLFPCMSGILEVIYVDVNIRSVNDQEMSRRTAA